MKNGVYVTDAGSSFTINGGSYVGDFDIIEEPNACIDCQLSDLDFSEPSISWVCDYCDGGYALLHFISKGE
ncbi:MAG: hypothetical protein ACKO96_04895 [Flammeovirgaceae bacterium]